MTAIVWSGEKIRLNLLKKRAMCGSIATVLVLCCIMIPYQVSAVIVDIEGLQSTYQKGDTIVFYVNVEIESGERIPINFISLVLQKGPQGYILNFTATGVKLSGPWWANVEFMSTYGSGYGYGYYYYQYDYGERYGYDHQYGYGYDFGYGYGYRGDLRYKITLDSNGMDAGIYDVWAEVDTGSSIHPKFSSDFYQFELVQGTNKPKAPTVTSISLTGPSMENISIMFDASPDDGGGFDNVVQYNIYRSVNGGPYNLYDVIPAVNAIIYSWSDSWAGDGDLNFYNYTIRASDGTQESEDTVPHGKTVIPLTNGKWKLISIPLVQYSNNFFEVFGTIDA